MPKSREGEAFLVNAHISEYSHGNLMNHMPVRRRKLLLHRGEIEKLRVGNPRTGTDDRSDQAVSQRRTDQGGDRRGQRQEVP